ncbi:hypothetical protein [Larsenimonas rhizosphaerae]|uniref:Porin n=1 Tax=Larsenimonas rhizosphaerae TaxID=2944682 RepID=A0AA42CUW1_9GAMM|nr:hypothetical protein [Larsenimonas rhizosphaerae]MCM2129717.1 hypothetical protein [Larsenimonas rhizosphaerae]MCX2524376.1 hypothetical protein [Larsenimonas rhizosphaerae]
MSACVFCRWIKWPLGMMAFVGSSPVFAQSVADTLDTLQFHGFMSQALVISDHNDFFGPSSSKGGSLQFYELGLNASLRPSDNLLISAQVLSRRAGDDSAKPELDYGVIDYQVYSGNSTTLGIKIGRVKNPFGFYNETRDVPFTRTGILLPQSIYFDRTRTQSISGDGVAEYFEKRFTDSSIRFQVGWGLPQVDDNVKNTILPDALPGSIKAKNSLISQLSYEYGGGRFITAITYGKITAEYDSSSNGPGNGEFSYEPVILSAQYNSMLWSLTSEIAVRKREFSGIPDSRFNDSSTSGSWYLQYAYRFNNKWQGFLRYDALISDLSDMHGKEFASQGNGDDYSRYAFDNTLGLKWLVTPKFMLAAEYHNIEGTGWLYKPNENDNKKYWDLFLFQASYRF